MTEVQLALSYGALHALCIGDELSFRVDREVTVTLKMDDSAMRLLAEQFNAFVLQLATPTGPHTH